MDEITLWGEGAGCFKSLLRKGKRQQAPALAWALGDLLTCEESQSLGKGLSTIPGGHPDGTLWARWLRLCYFIFSSLSISPGS